ncbi:D-glycero-alpha-D-manno-heptose-1,7-bisphosphate 7-phosphatase [Solitalea koreensis]|uniref:D,D-heptose 1,7-bisphosphate phosphatase n=1 Tax=Solitalea koreensis TaxID=543615 RepID=A0A521D9P3_9SPHI|nr:HAD family hydrolase [Solitalea koreensis]SMO68373.1 D-glycero-D-manno-heptose 1,7-bisphosphate phosphatase [Solitalea koreensis]
MNKAVFLDRDGVLNKELGDYVCTLADFQVLEHNYEPLKQLHDAGYLLIVVTNQGGLAKGWYTEATLQSMHTELRRQFAMHGVEFAEIYYCNHHPEYTGNCFCRKPGSLLLEKAIARFNIDKNKACFIGDRERDVEAGEKAGIKGILIDSDQPLSEVLHLVPGFSV